MRRNLQDYHSHTMRKFYLFLFSLFVLCSWAVQAAPTFNSSSRYRFSCKRYGSGVLALGSAHGAQPYFYYLTDTEQCDDGWWYITATANGWYIQNAQSMQYITYTGQRIGQKAKGLEPTNYPQGNASEWQLVEEGDGYWSVRNVQDPTQWFNQRVDGSYLLGSYPGSGTDNELFKIYDETGKEVHSSGTVGGSLQSAVDTLLLGGKPLVYDKKSQTYYASVPSAMREQSAWATALHYVLSEGQPADAQLSIENTEALQGDSILISPLTCDEDYTLSLAQGEEVLASAKLRFTFLPIVEMTLASCNGTDYTMGEMRVVNPESEGYDSLFTAKMKYRGATAQSFPKKSYAVKFCDAEGSSVNRSFFGLREDKSWILDAMYVDRACMRNRVATDLWNDFATLPYYAEKEPDALTGTRGRFVEVFLNGTYHGLYCMTEKIDRKQLKLKKFKEAEKTDTGVEEIHGLLYKSSDWTYEVFMGHELNNKYYPHHAPSSYNNWLGVETWRGFEIKYPDFEKEAVDWKPLYDAINFVATSSQINFDRDVKTKFDYPMLRDYYLFIELMLATDNHGKNMFYYVYDEAKEKYQKLSVAPWDMDGTFGQNYYAETSYTNDATQDFDTFLWKYEHGQLTLFSMLEKSSLDWDEDLATRYAELRSSWFNPDSLAARFAGYASLFADSHADQREQTAWPKYHSDLQSEATYAEDWVKERIAALDEKYGYDPTVTGITPAKAEDYLSVVGSKGAIAVKTSRPTKVFIYNLQGILVRTTNVGRGLTPIYGLVPGAYVVNGKKVIVE